MLVCQSDTFSVLVCQSDTFLVLVCQSDTLLMLVSLIPFCHLGVIWPVRQQGVRLGALCSSPRILFEWVRIGWTSQAAGVLASPRHSFLASMMETSVKDDEDCQERLQFLVNNLSACGLSVTCPT